VGGDVNVAVLYCVAGGSVAAEGNVVGGSVVGGSVAGGRSVISGIRALAADELPVDAPAAAGFAMVGFLAG
jgi:hypothetical protein